MAQDFRPDARSLILAPIGAILFGIVPFFVVGLVRGGIDTASLLFWRYFFSLCILVPLALVLRQPLVAAWRAGGRGLLLTSLTLGAFQTFCYFKAVEYIPTSIAILFFYCYPLMTLLLQRVLQGMRAPGTTIAACLLILAGAGAMAVGALRGDGIHVPGLLLAAIVPVCYGFYIISLSRFAARLSALPSAIFMQSGLLCSYGIGALITGLDFATDTAAWMRLLAIATLGSALPMLIMAYCLPRLGPAGFGIMSSLELVTVVVVGVMFLGETLSPGQWAGIVFVLCGILIYRPARSGSDTGSKT
jgi:drug/metabolite transporter (DMT)-like permease